jgi:hypothetical protein
MKPVDQTKLGVDGNCYSACLASILELSVEEVPVFGLGPVSWLIEAEKWLRAKHGYTMIGFDPVVVENFYCRPAMHHLIRGESPRGPHAVVGFCGEIVYDPHPSRDGLVMVSGYEFLIPIDDRLIL